MNPAVEALCQTYCETESSTDVTTLLAAKHPAKADFGASYKILDTSYFTVVPTPFAGTIVCTDNNEDEWTFPISKL